MCGICGFVNLDGAPADRSILERMNHALIHRGPDGAGELVDGAVALAMRRLAIIDLEGGRQPMSNEDGQVWIVFNGEIYNSPELMRQLQASGHSFSTRNSDTETIVHQYEATGFDCTEQLRGMFAFAIYDKRARSDDGKAVLFLARDRMGIKPLFYYLDERVLAFASELTSLVQHPQVPREIEPTALRQYLATGAVPGPFTMFKNVRQLLPAQRLVLRGSRVDIERYWQIPPVSNQASYDFADAAAQVRHLLEESVQMHLLADVPVGAFLSGGIDSSTMVALAARLSGHRIQTFSVRFEEAEYDESRFARLVAERYGTEHHEFTVPNLGFSYDLLETLLTHHGQPTADTSAIPTFLVSQLARKFAKVVVSGDGGDEVFAGYSHFGWSQQIDRLYAFPRILRRAAHDVAQWATYAPGLRNSAHLRQIKNATLASLDERCLIPLQVLRLNQEPEICQLLRPEWHRGEDPQDDMLNDFLRDIPSGDGIGQAQRFAFRYYLPDAYLAKVDRMSMATALEVRVPFLDHHVVEFAMALPGSIHWQNGTGKQVLRSAVSGLLPDEIFSHRKQGFSIPLHRWANAAYFDVAHDLLGETAVRRRGIFDPTQVRSLLNRCQNGTSSLRAQESDYRLSHRLFMLVVFEMWCRFYLDDLIPFPSETLRWDSMVREVVYG